MTNRSRLKTSRLGRLGVLGKLAGGIAIGAISESSSQLSKGRRPKLKDVLLTPANLERVGARLSEMRGAAMKVGQLLSMDAGSLMPPEFSQLLSHLRNSAHSMPLGEVAKILNRQWGAGWEQKFEQFNFTPIAAASIGQVHQATLKDGRKIAIKIQYPQVRRSIDSDVDNVATLLKLSSIMPSEIDLQTLLDEAKRQLHSETDYILEAESIKRYTEFLSDDARFELPQVIPELTTTEVLSMTYLDGMPIDQLSENSALIRNATATALLELSLKEVFDWGLVQTDPNFANYLYNPARNTIQLLDFGATREYTPERREILKQLLQACFENADSTVIEQHAAGLGYLDRSDTEKYKNTIVNLLRTATEPARETQHFSFQHDTIAERMRDIVMEMRMSEGFTRIPPADMLFLHRKLGGLYLLFSQIRATIPVREHLYNYV